MLLTKFSGKYLTMFSFGKYEFVSRKAKPYLHGNRAHDCITIVARHTSYDTGNRPIVQWAAINQFRPVIGEFIWELPAGKIDKGETIKDAAKRELKEETGLDLTKILNVRGGIFSTVGMTDEQHVVVTCECSGELSTEYLEHDEQIKPYLIDKTEVLTLCSDDSLLKAMSFLLLLNC